MRGRTRQPGRHDPEAKGIARAAILLLALAVAGSAALLIRERAVALAQERAASWIDRTVPPTLQASAAGTPARARLADALFLAQRAAATSNASEYRALLGRADAELAAAIPARPYWGEAWVVSAFVQSLHERGGAVVSLGSFARSYSDAPFLRYAAAWRVQYGFVHWEMLDPVTRDHVLEEAVWLASLDGEALPRIFDMARASPAYYAFLLHWRAARQ